MSEKREALKNRIVDFAVVDPATLVPNKRNWRQHPEAQRAAMNGALNEVGWVGVVTVNRTTGNLVDGHLRRDVALQRKEKGIPAIFVELSEAEERMVLASLDPIGALATTDREMLDGLLADIEAQDEDMAAFLESLKAPDLLGPSEGNDDSGESEKLPKLKWREYEIPLTVDEVVKLGALADRYLEENGAFHGFVKWLVKHVPA